jgi:nucleoside-diphosphate-sugar epimerase
MKILITGTGGYIGSHLARSLSKKYNVVGLSRSKPDLNITSYQGDIRDAELVRKVLKDEDIQTVFHLAGVLKSHDEAENTDVNVEGTKNVVKAFYESDATKIIFSSSGKAYGKVSQIPTPETHALNATAPYGASKAKAEQFFHEQEGKHVVVLRQTYLYGPGMRSDFLVPTIIDQVRNGSVTLRNADVKRDFVHINDLIELYEMLIQKEKSSFGVYNVGPGESVSIRDMISIVADLFDKKVEVKSLGQPEENEEELLDVSKIKEHLGWKSKLSYEAGLKLCL